MPEQESSERLETPEYLRARSDALGARVMATLGAQTRADLSHDFESDLAADIRAFARCVGEAGKIVIDERDRSRLRNLLALWNARLRSLESSSKTGASACAEADAPELAAFDRTNVGRGIATVDLPILLKAMSRRRVDGRTLEFTSLRTSGQDPDGLRGPFRGAVFVECQFEDLDFARVVAQDESGTPDMREVRFVNCTFRGVRFDGLTAASSRFESCVFEACQFVGSDLSKSGFLYSKIVGCQFTDVDMTEATLGDCRIRITEASSVFERVNLKAGNVVDTEFWAEGPRGEHGKRSRDDPECAYFTSTDLPQTVFSACSFNFGAKFDKCNAEKSMFLSCMLDGVVFYDTSCKEATFESCDLNRASFVGTTDLTGVWFRLCSNLDTTAIPPMEYSKLIVERGAIVREGTIAADSLAHELLDGVDRRFRAGELSELLSDVRRRWPDMRQHPSVAAFGEVCRRAMLAAFEAREYADGALWRNRALRIFATAGHRNGIALLMLPDVFRFSENITDADSLDVPLAILDEMESLVQPCDSSFPFGTEINALRLIHEKRGFVLYRGGRPNAALAAYRRALQYCEGDERGRLKVQGGMANCRWLMGTQENGRELRQGLRRQARQETEDIIEAAAVLGDTAPDVHKTAMQNLTRMKRGRDPRPYEIE